MKLNILIPGLIISALILRILALFFFGDTGLENEWRILAHNLSEKGILGYFIVNDTFKATPGLAKLNDIVLPSAFMPPLYAYIIFIVKYIFSSFINFVNIILIFQILFSLIGIYLFLRILQIKETQNVSFFTALIFSLIPINIYATVQISSVSIQVFLLIYFFYILRLFSDHKKISQKNLFIFSILSGLLILLRGEFILFYILTIIYFFLYYVRNIKFFLMSLIITLLVISPYVVRNYYHFNTFTITKSIGYNLLKGNNPHFKIEGNPSFIDKKFNRENLSIKTDKNYEIKLDNFYKEKALEFIKKDPGFYLKNYFIKVISFLTFDPYSSYEKYFNLLHLAPKVVLSILSFFGGIISIKKKGFLQYLSFYFFSNILFFSIFFILPRYSLILLPIQILLSLEFVKFLLRKFVN
tara:strand:+ start:527 stop:1762 length:1236 start_codon:yes stop_codon:yes gene_type:complete